MSPELGRGSRCRPEARSRSIGRQIQKIHHYPEAKLVNVESQASFLIANEDHDEVQAEIGILTVQAQKGSVNPKGQRRVAHPRDYTFEDCFSGRLALRVHSIPRCCSLQSDAWPRNRVRREKAVVQSGRKPARELVRSRFSGSPNKWASSNTQSSVITSLNYSVQG